jgi:hypothetical protein
VSHLTSGVTFQSQSYGSKKNTIRITAKFGKRAATAQVVPLGHVQLLRTKTIFVIGHRTEVVACVRPWRFNLWTPGVPIASILGGTMQLDYGGTDQPAPAFWWAASATVCVIVVPQGRRSDHA